MSTDTTVMSPAERLEVILADIDDKVLADDLRNQFFLVNPLEYARLLHSLSLPDKVKGQLLALRVGMPPAYAGTDIQPLISRAMDLLWQKLVDDTKGLRLGAE